MPRRDPTPSGEDAEVTLVLESGNVGAMRHRPRLAYLAVASSGATPMSSSRSGQWIARPPSVIRRLARRAGGEPREPAERHAHLAAIDQRNDKGGALNAGGLSSGVDGGGVLNGCHARAPRLPDTRARTAERSAGLVPAQGHCRSRDPSPAQARARTLRGHRSTPRERGRACACRCSRSTRSRAERAPCAADQPRSDSRCLHAARPAPNGRRWLAPYRRRLTSDSRRQLPCWHVDPLWSTGRGLLERDDLASGTRRQPYAGTTSSRLRCLLTAWV